MTERRRCGEKLGMQIGSADLEEDARQKNRLARKQYEAMLLEKKAAEEAEQEAELQERVLADDDANEGEDPGTLVEVVPDEKPPSSDAFSRRNNVELSKLAETSMRFNLSVRGTAATCTAFLGDLINAGEISPSKSYLAVDPRKLRRERDKVLASASERGAQQTDDDDVTHIMFDSRLDQTMVRPFDEETGKYYPRTEIQDHYTLVDGDGRFLVHFTKPPKENQEEFEEEDEGVSNNNDEDNNDEDNNEDNNDEETTEVNESPEDKERRERLSKIIDEDPKPSSVVARMMYSWMQLHGIDQTLQFLTGDSTNSNTGWKGGIMAWLERFLGRKVTWIVCQLHTNELGLRHLMEELDGKTNSKTGWKGDLGKLLKSTNDMRVNYEFEQVDLGPELIKLPEEVRADLSNDQKLLYDRAHAIRSGQLSRDVALKKGGSLVHSRWLTFAAELLKMWMSDHGLVGDLLERLRTLVTYILTVYVPMWFNIKVHHSWIEGPRHVLTHLQLLRLQAPDVQKILLPYLKTSSWFAHSESILQTMLCSPDQTEREFAIKKILKMRGKAPFGKTGVRYRKLPKLNVEATCLADLINWNRSHEPLLTCTLTKDEIKRFDQEPMVVPYHCGHAQAVERAVKEVTAASDNVVGEDRRDGWIRSRCESRNLVQRVDTKSDLAGLIPQRRT